MLDDADRACKACGGALEEMGVAEESEEIDVIAREFVLSTSLTRSRMRASGATSDQLVTTGHGEEVRLRRSRSWRKEEGGRRKRQDRAGHHGGYRRERPHARRFSTAHSVVIARTGARRSFAIRLQSSSLVRPREWALPEPGSLATPWRAGGLRLSRRPAELGRPARSRGLPRRELEHAACLRESRRTRRLRDREGGARGTATVWRRDGGLRHSRFGDCRHSPCRPYHRSRIRAGGAVVYQVKNDVLKLKTVLNWIPLP